MTPERLDGHLRISDLPPEADAPSDWVRHWLAQVPAGSAVLDLACGKGRHVRHARSLGLAVTGVDRDAQALAHLPSDAQALLLDLEADPEAAMTALGVGVFAAVVVCHYLHRPLLPWLLRPLADQGLLIYETFAQGQQHLGRPSRPDFLLQPGELLNAWPGFAVVVAYEEGWVQRPLGPAIVQRAVLRKSGRSLP